MHINQCREGYIDRIFIAGNSFGSDVCVQRITIINDAPFTESNIRWPGDFDTTTCAAGALTPGSLAYGKGFPIITEDKCDLVGINYEDHLFRFINGSDACYKIIRKWKVINWCRFYDITGAPIIYEHDQIIMFERDEYISFANCGLPYYIGNVITDREDLLVQTVEGMSERFNLDIRNFSEVVDINRNDKKVTVRKVLTNEIYEESYDVLV